MTDCDIRKKVYNQFYDLLYDKILISKKSKKDKLEQDHIANTKIKNIEISIYNYTITYCQRYNIPLNFECPHFEDTYVRIAIGIYSNIKYHNPDLIEQIKNGNINCAEIGFKKPEELHPTIWNDLLTKHKDLLKNAYEVKMVAMSDHIVCRQCKSREIAYYEFQSRKADEGSSTAYTCLKCNYKWKKN